jgi:FtsP/CotA-like multicopper oxidase with cupredoxin domain
MLTRRTFAVGGAAMISVGTLDRSRAGGAPLRADLPLPIPALIEAGKAGRSVKLRIASARHAFLEGKPATTYGYSAPVLGPVVRVRRGDEVEMAVENALDRDTTVHWHGLQVPGDVDGGPHQVIAPGSRWRAALKIDQPASTAWFHPHPHHDTARQLYMGLAGMIIIEDGSDAAIDLPHTYGVDDLPIILQDRSFGRDGALIFRPSPLATAYGSRGDTVIVNGAIAPTARVPRGLVRLRLLDAANARNFYLHFSDGRRFHVIASDGGFLSAPVAVSRLTISPGERFEILVDFSDHGVVTLETGPDEAMGLFGGPTAQVSGEYEPVMRFEPVATPDASKALPARLLEPVAADVGKAARRRRFILDSSMCTGEDRLAEAHADNGRVMCINGKPHDMARIDEEVQVGTTEIWEILSIGMAHPFHIHGASFRILSIGAAQPPAHLMGWKDVVLVEDKAELLVAFHKPATSQRPFMYHCHIAEHEEAGMMGQYVCA